MFWNKRILLIFLIPIIFFTVGILTLPHYGISWDEPLHFERGQAYLHFYLTGKTNFLDLPSYPDFAGTSDYVDRKGEDPLYTQAPKNLLPTQKDFRRSYYQSDVITIDNFLSRRDGGHPPVSDILASFFNLIFYQKLGILGDIESYHLYEVFMVAVAILVISCFTFKNFGLFAGLISGLTLSLYPLFFAESHFNIKDPPQAAFFSLAIITFYFAVVNKKFKFFIFSAIFAGLALGTKLNALFLPFIILPWLLFKSFVDKEGVNRKLMLTLILLPLLTLTVFFAFWPFLWQDTLEHLVKVLNYYQNIGVGYSDQLNKYVFWGFNFYPLLWIVYTTPIPVLTLFTIGFIYTVFLLFKKKSHFSLLLLLWLLVPILRVSVFDANIYGGVRQIMEYIPAMALIAGVGAHFIWQKANLRYRYFIAALIFIPFVFVSFELIRIHPNQNVYFNQLIGGLSGAKEKNIPSWGNSYGNAYKQAVDWLNENAENNAKVGLAISNMTNLPRVKLRKDIQFSNGFPSGPKMAGEYVIELSHDWPIKNWYSYAYLDKFLIPVYEVKVDGVAIAKIWKNDLQHTKEKPASERLLTIQSDQVDGSQIIIDLQNESFINKLVINHDDLNCNEKQIGGFIRLSTDKINWVQEPETIDYPQIPISWLEDNEKRFVFLTTSKKAKYILLDTQMDNSCILKNPRVEIYGFD